MIFFFLKDKDQKESDQKEKGQKSSRFPKSTQGKKSCRQREAIGKQGKIQKEHVPTATET